LVGEDPVLLRKLPDLIGLLAHEGFQAAKSVLDILRRRGSVACGGRR
jgi:hypothetical protein